jgi:hypothetical protein
MTLLRLGGGLHPGRRLLPTSLYDAMAAFDEIGSSTPLREIAQEWRLEGRRGSQASLDDESELTFDVGLHRILACFFDLRMAIGEDDSTHPFSSDENLATKVEALGEAIRAVASVKSTLDRLLAIRDENARVVLEALQKVRSVTSWTTDTDELQYLDLIPEAHPRRKGALHLIVRLAYRSGRLPESLYVKDITLRHARWECGGNADVFEGTLGERTIAIKRPRRFGDAAARQVSGIAVPQLCITYVSPQRLTREALVWRQLRHPNVVLFVGLNDRLFPDHPFPALLSSWMVHGTLKVYMQLPSFRGKETIIRLVRTRSCR